MPMKAPSAVPLKAGEISDLVGFKGAAGPFELPQEASERLLRSPETRRKSD